MIEQRGGEEIPTAYGTWLVKFKFELNKPFVHLLLMAHAPTDCGRIQPHSRRKEPRRQ
jgi:hypothetical protein